MRYRDFILAKALGRGAKGAAVGFPAMLGVSGGGTEYTVTGVSPLVLAAALRKPVHSLVQSGVCEQASTPAPSTPVDIYCNNGRLVAVDDELPAAYKRVLGFKCNNNAMWEITGFKLRGSDTVRASFSVEAACNVWGCYQGADATDNYDLYASVSSGSKYLRYGNGTYLSYFSNADLGVRFNTVCTPTGTTGMPQDSTWTPKTFESANDLLIGSTTIGGTSSKLKGNFWAFEVDGRLKLVPCERVSDGVLGWYDTYSETFYPPYTGYTGAVSLGYDGSHYSLAVVGTDEVITLGEQTASAVDLFAAGDYADTQDIISGAITREVGIKVFDGTETISTSNACFTIPINDRVTSKTTLRCSHFPYSTKTSSQTEDGTVISFSSTNIGFRYDACADKTAFAAWLKAQYDAGTPVIVIYPLATETAESATPQELHTNKGDNTIIVTAEVSNIPLSATYIKEAS